VKYVKYIADFNSAHEWGRPQVSRMAPAPPPAEQTAARQQQVGKISTAMGPGTPVKMMNYKCIMATRTDEKHNATLATVAVIFGDVRTTDEMVALFNAGPNA
jgi:hypothetical protein